MNDFKGWYLRLGSGVHMHAYMFPQTLRDIHTHSDLYRDKPAGTLTETHSEEDIQGHTHTYRDT